jgi:hypothetical protein
MTPEELKQELNNFSGTEHYYRFNALMPNVLLTDGTQFLAGAVKAFWLMDVIGSHLPSVPKDESFVVASLIKLVTGGANFALADDYPANKCYASQAIEYTDFPLDEIKLYAQFDGENWVIMLPGEY